MVLTCQFAEAAGQGLFVLKAGLFKLKQALLGVSPGQLIGGQVLKHGLVMDRCGVKICLGYGLLFCQAFMPLFLFQGDVGTTLYGLLDGAVQLQACTQLFTLQVEQLLLGVMG